jgi:hypothetical protein
MHFYPMKKNLFFPLFFFLCQLTFGQQPWEVGLYGGVDFALLNSRGVEFRSPPPRPDVNGFNVGVKGAWSFHKHLALETRLGILKRENESLERYLTQGSGLGGVAPWYDYQKQVDLEHQVRLRVNLLPKQRVQPWLAAGYAQLIKLKPLEKDRQVDFPLTYPINPYEFKSYQAALTYAAGIRVQLTDQFSADLEGNVRHFIFDQPEYSAYSRNMMFGGQLGLVYGW